MLPAEAAWTLTLPSAPSAAGAMDAERIYIPLNTGEIAALDRQTGANVWQADAKTDLPPVVRDGVLYTAGDTDLRALDAATGALLWAARVERKLAGSLLVQNGLLLTVMSPDDVLAHRISDGYQIWRHSLGGTAGERRMAVGATAVFVTGPGGHVAALSLVDGHPLWEQTIPGSLSAPVAAQDRVFVGSTDNFFYALSARSGRLEWKWRAGGDVVGAAADKEAVYFVSLDNEVRAVNRGNGNQRWQKETATRPTGAPIVVGPVVVVPGVGTTVSAFSALTGAPIGMPFTAADSAELEGQPMFDPTLLPFEVAAAILTRDGRIVAMRPTGMMFREALPAAFTQLPGRRLNREPPPIAPASDAGSR